MTAYRRGRNELVVGALALASIAVFLVMFGALTSRGVIRWSSDLYVLLPSAEGLLRGDAVLFRGVPVGEVREIGFADGQVLVRARMHREVPITDAAEAALTPVDMFGRQSIVLQEAGATGAPIADGDTLAGREPRRLTDRIEGVGHQLERLLGDSTLALVRGALAGIGAAGAGVSATGDELSGLLSDQRGSLLEVTRAMETLTGNLASATDSVELERLRSGLGAALESVTRATARLDTASLAALRLLDRLDRGEGSVGLALRDPALYHSTAAAIRELELLIRDVRSDPGRFVSLSLF